jgi:hypothetical protein
MAMADPISLDRSFLIARAERCRSLASTFFNPILRERMLELASDYDELAEKSDALTPLGSTKVSKLKS